MQSRFGMSLIYNEHAGDDFAFGIDFVRNSVEAGLDFDIEINHSVKANQKNWQELWLGGYVGHRVPLKGHTVLSYGLNGGVNFVSDLKHYDQGEAIDHDPFIVGPYLGLAYEMNEHSRLFMRINPVSYESFGYDSGSTNANNQGKQNEWEIFNEGQVGYTYYF